MIANDSRSHIIDYAKNLGFDDVRMTPVSLPTEYDETFREWIKNGFHADMHYLSNRVANNVVISDLLKNTKSVIILALNYYQHEEMSNLSGGQISRYAVSRDYHKIIKKKLKQLCRYIGQEYSGETRAFVDTGPILEKAYGETSGIGYIGKNGCLITEEYGSWVFLSVILTSLDLPADLQSMKINCGSCTRCIDACPTDAINQNKTIDARRCISYLTIENKSSINNDMRDKMSDWIFGCDICQEVCPHNIRAVSTNDSGFKTTRFKGRYISLSDILKIKTDDEFLNKFAGTPIMRAKRRGLIRNACVAAGNSTDQNLIPLLEDISKTNDLMLKDHALWALDKLKSKC